MVKIKIKDKNDEKNQINFLYVYENEFDSYTIDLVRDSKETIYRIKD